jgi:hypothetical protein
MRESGDLTHSSDKKKQCRKIPKINVYLLLRNRQNPGVIFIIMLHNFFSSPAYE